VDDYFSESVDSFTGIRIWQKEFPHKKLFANSFEFSTYGGSLFQVLRSMRTILFENRAHCSSSKIRNQGAHAFGEMFATKKKPGVIKPWRKLIRSLKAEGDIE